MAGVTTVSCAALLEHGFDTTNASFEDEFNQLFDNREETQRALTGFITSMNALSRRR